MQDAYKQDENVKAVKQIFITDPSFDFDTFAGVAKLNEGITVTLDHILKNLKMDCNVCSFKEICDTIEGMRDVHKREDYEFWFHKKKKQKRAILLVFIFTEKFYKLCEILIYY